MRAWLAQIGPFVTERRFPNLIFRFLWNGFIEWLRWDPDYWLLVSLSRFGSDMTFVKVWDFFLWVHCFCLDFRPGWVAKPFWNSFGLKQW
jgi:hypothetical protein